MLMTDVWSVAVAAFLAALSQWQFQIATGNGWRRLAKQYFELELPGGSLPSETNKCVGQALRLSALVLWVVSIGAFIFGALAAAMKIHSA